MEGKMTSNIELKNKEEIKATKAKVEYYQKDLRDFLYEVKNNMYSIPSFQRKFVWSHNQIINFLNAMNMGFPFGTVTIWEEEYNGVSQLEERNQIIKNYKKTTKISGKIQNWVLDGQQRTTSIVACIKNLDKNRRGKDIIFSIEDNLFKKKEQQDHNFIYAKHLLDDQFTNQLIINK